MPGSHAGEQPLVPHDDDDRHTLEDGHAGHHVRDASSGTRRSAKGNKKKKNQNVRLRTRKDSWWKRNVSRPFVNSIKGVFIKKRPPPSPRSIFINEPIPADYFNKKGRPLRTKTFPSNQNVTSKYTVLTFLPRNLFEQFRRVANVFFLAIDILQFFPKFATVSPGLVILPLIVVLLITAGKDGFEDVKRHQADRVVNHSVVHTLGGGGYENKNPMGKKSKTFVKGIPLPKIKSKKKRLAEQQAADEAAATAQATAARPRNSRSIDHTDAHGMMRVRSQVSHWDEDPEAGDDQNELGWQRTIWEDLKVGDFVKIYEGEQVPADVVVCSTSEEEDIAYVETKNLDGETNLKSRHGIQGLSFLESATACSKVRMRLDLDSPEVNMYRLNGAVVMLDDPEGANATHAISLDTTLLRGCVLRNTAWVIAVVVFTGDDTKIVQNSGGTPSKRSKVERQMNPQVLFNLAVLGAMSLACGIVDHVLEVSWYRDNSYWTLYDDRPGDNTSINGLITFLNALITFQNIIPISLYISIEFVRTVQALFIFWDHDMQYFKNGHKYRTLARSWNLSDDLGQIEYIFSDKTGTLTQNVMVFRQCSVGGHIYYGDSNNGTDDEDIKKNQLKPTVSDSGNSDSEINEKNPQREIPPFHDAQLQRDLAESDTEQSRILHGFFAVLGLCHTAVVAEPEAGVIEYKAQSPDEAALVQAAADVGFVFLGRDRNILRLRTPFSSEPDEYELLNVLEFSSARKRMSVVVRKLDSEGRLFLLCKGADNIIFDRLSKNDETQAKLQEQTDKDLQTFASEGLRTLCLAYRLLDSAEYEEWAQEYHNAEIAMEDREQKIEDVSAKLECNLSLLGATAIEDKLQDGVPQTIADLKRAGIKVWVATGDKLETAVAIGYTTNLLTPDANLIIVRDGHHTIYQQLKDSLEGFFGDYSLSGNNSLEAHHTRRSVQLQRVNTGAHSLVGDDNGTRPGGFSLVIDGSALAQAFADDETSDLLLNLSIRCNTVICCRVSPLQKAQIVRLIKDNLGVMCLAVGDGANDVSMIQAADVGVGISGEEGLQAVNSSDFAIGQFRFLKRLLLVHGHWSYFRNSTMICNFFYKNVVGFGILFWFQIYCGWSTTYVYPYIFLLFWNVFWTLCPVIAMGLFERNIDDDILMALPELYRYPRQGLYYNWPRFLYYLFEGVYQTAVVYFFLCYAYDTTTARGDGFDVFKDEMATVMAIVGVFVANLFSGLNIDSWSWWVVFAVWIGPFLIWLFTAVYTAIPPTLYQTNIYGLDEFLFRAAACWFGWAFTLIIALLPRYLIKFAKQNIFPTDIDIMRLVRKYHPEIDVKTDPMLGGKLDHTAQDQAIAKDVHGIRTSSERPYTPSQGHEDIAMRDFSTSPGGKTPTALRNSMDAGRTSFESARQRPSFQSQRFGMQPSTRTGSQVDMSTGLHREASRGFDFTMEEHGVAIQRMQSRLSELSNKDRSRGGAYTLRRLAGNRNSQLSAGSGNESPFGRLRTRAGSILKSRNRSSTTNTRHSQISNEEVMHSPTHGLSPQNTGAAVAPGTPGAPGAAGAPPIVLHHSSGHGYGLSHGRVASPPPAPSSLSHSQQQQGSGPYPTPHGTRPPSDGNEHAL